MAILGYALAAAFFVAGWKRVRLIYVLVVFGLLVALSALGTHSQTVAVLIGLPYLLVFGMGWGAAAFVRAMIARQSKEIRPPEATINEK